MMLDKRKILLIGGGLALLQKEWEYSKLYSKAGTAVFIGGLSHHIRCLFVFLVVSSGSTDEKRAA